MRVQIEDDCVIIVMKKRKTETQHSHEIQALCVCVNVIIVLHVFCRIRSSNSAIDHSTTEIGEFD
jgi:hypothetical protein